MGEGTIGTVGQCQSLPWSIIPIVATPPSDATELSQRKWCANETARLIRNARLRDLLASIAEWERASGPDRTYWRRDARHRLAEWRRLHQEPELAAFQAAVDRSRT